MKTILQTGSRAAGTQTQKKRSPAPACHCLSNTGGSWELTFNRRSAVIPQHESLFYLAWLLLNPTAGPISAAGLAAKVYHTFETHLDFAHYISWLPHSRRQSIVTTVLRQKEQTLQAILDTPGQDEVVKVEVERELEVIYDLQSTYITELASTPDAIGRTLSVAFRNLYARLATSIDLKGNPHPVLRSFSRHLLLYVLIPSTKASRPGNLRFSYEPPNGTNWQS